MIVLVKRNAPEEAVQELLGTIEQLGLRVRSLDLRRGRAYEVLGEDRGKVLQLRRFAAVEQILTRRVPHETGEPVWPTFAFRILLLGLVVIIGLLLLSAFSPPRLGDQAFPELDTGGRAVEWYLRPLASFLDIFGERGATLGGVLILVLWLAFLFWPFLDKAEPDTPGGRRIALVVRLMGAALVLFVVVLALR